MPQQGVEIYLDDNGNPDYKRSVLEAAHTFGVDPRLAVGLLRQESGSNPNALSSKGAIGLMQLMPDTAKRYGVDPTNPSQNIEGGIRYLLDLKQRYKGDPVLMLAAYHAGEGAVDKAGGMVPNIPSTQQYVRSILGDAALRSHLPTPPPATMGSDGRYIDASGKPLGQLDTGSLPTEAQKSTKPAPWNTIEDIGTTGKNLGTNILEAVKDPKNWPMLLGMLGGAGGSQVAMRNQVSSLPKMLGIIGLGAGSGGAIGEGAKEHFSEGKGATQIDPLDLLKQFAIQGGAEVATGGASHALKRGGSATYASGAGLNRSGFSQNFPTAAQQGLEGGLLSLPVITSMGANRVYNRAAQVAPKLVQEAENSGVRGPTAVDIARTGVRPVIREIAGGAELRSAERGAAINQTREFIRDRSHITPARTIPGIPNANIQAPVSANGAVGNNGMPITRNYSIQGTPSITIPEQVTPLEIPLTQLQTLKQGLQDRAKASNKAVNADRFPGLNARVTRGEAIGAQLEAENRVPGLKEANRRTQGAMGLNQSLNPSFRTADELMGMGVDEATAKSMTSNTQNTYYPRLVGDATAALLSGGAAHHFSPDNPLTSLLTALGTGFLYHIGASPMGRRVIGAGAYTEGRMLPSQVRAIRFGEADYETQQKKDEALRKALAGQQ